MSLPLVHLYGTPHEQGVTHGSALRERIGANLALYFERFERETGLRRPQVLEMASQYADAIAGQSPDYYAAMKGVAEGGDFELLAVAALNVRYEILYYQFGRNALAAAAHAVATTAAGHDLPIDGCTAFAALPAATASGHLLMGQNWDWIPDVLGAVLHTTDPDGFETIGFTEAGIVGAKIGLNAAGLGIGLNGMTTVDDDWSRLARPVHVRCYEMLRSRTLDAARAVITSEVRSCSTNFLLAQVPDQVADVEAAPDVVNVLGCGADGCLTHANHFVDAAALGIEETPNERRIYSVRRAARLAELLHARLPLTVESIQDALRDTRDDPFGLSRHRDLTVEPEFHYTTVTSVVMDLPAQTMHLTDGPPDLAPYETVAL